MFSTQDKVGHDLTLKSTVSLPKIIFIWRDLTKYDFIGWGIDVLDHLLSNNVNFYFGGGHQNENQVCEFIELPREKSSSVWFSVDKF